MGVSLADPPVDVCPTCAKESTQQAIKKDLETKPTIDSKTASTLYQRDNSLTFANIFTNFKAAWAASPFVAAAAHFLTITDISGNCPVWDISAYVFYLRLDHFCGDTMAAMWPWIRALILFMFSLISFRWAVL